MNENKNDVADQAVQIDRESQEYGSQHGQDTQGRDTGSSAPTITSQAEQEQNTKPHDGAGALAGEDK